MMHHRSDNLRTVWPVILCSAAVSMITSGIRMSLGLFVQPMVGDTALSIANISFALALALTQLMWGVSQPLTGALADRFGAWPVLFWGTLLLAAGCTAVPLLDGVWGLALTLGIMIAFGSGAGGYSILMSQAAHKVPARMRGTASGIINAGGSFGQFLFAPLIQGLIALPAAGWRGTMYVLAALSLIILPLSRLLTRNNRPAAPHAALAADSGGQTLKQALAQALKNRSYILLHLGFFTCGFHIAFLVTHLPTEVALCGLPPSVASWSLAVIGLSNMAGSLAAG